MQFGFLLMKTISNSSWLFNNVFLLYLIFPAHISMFCHLTFCSVVRFFLLLLLLYLLAGGGSRSWGHRNLPITPLLSFSSLSSSSPHKNSILLHKYSLIICNYVIEEVIIVFVRSNRILSACD